MRATWLGGGALLLAVLDALLAWRLRRRVRRIEGELDEGRGRDEPPGSGGE